MFDSAPLLTAGRALLTWASAISVASLARAEGADRRASSRQANRAGDLHRWDTPTRRIACRSPRPAHPVLLDEAGDIGTHGSLFELRHGSRALRREPKGRGWFWA